MENDKKIAQSSDVSMVDSDYIDALEYVVHLGSASISMIQRKCEVGYNKAGRIIQWMEDKGYVSGFDGAKARKVFLSKENFEELYRDNSIKLEALEFVITHGGASISLLQRRFSLPLKKAAKIIDWMEMNGYISVYEGKPNRTVFLTMEGFRKIFKK